MKKALRRFFIYLIIIVVAAIGGFLLYMMATDYEPEARTLVFQAETPDRMGDTTRISVLVWNIGYAGLSQEMDFFYDGGEQVRPQKEIVLRNMGKIEQTLLQHQDKDFILLQEVDKKAKRSYNIDHYQRIEEKFANWQAFYGKNYDVPLVPVPLGDPMGHVNAGLMTLSKHTPSAVVRHSFPGNYSFPRNLVMLDRCFLVNRYPLNGGKELLIINTHNSAYDDGGLRSQQMKFLKDFLLREYKNGNYIVVGGDWNQSPAGFEANFTNNAMDNQNRTDIPGSYLPDWQWAYDNTVPTNRRLATPYQMGSSPTTVIDFFLLSPNIETLHVETLNMDFQYSDHQPVKLEAKLLP